MTQKSGKTLLGVIARSGLIEKERLKSELESYQAAGHKSASGFGAHLVQAGLLTPWHLEKMLKGKHRGFFLGKYKLMGHLGTGGMSSVYLAVHTMLGKQRAIKVLPLDQVHSSSHLERFAREGRAAASIDHPNVVRVYDIDQDGQTHYLVMEFVEGEDLYRRVERDGRLPWQEACDYIAQAAEGLAAAHAKALVHRDVKPANLLLTPAGVVKLLDLGLALSRDDEESLTELHGEKVMGTADYLAPEQAISSHHVDHRADIYSLGCTLYYLLAGHPPFPEGTLAQRLALHQTAEPDAIDRDDCPQGLLAVCRMMMQKDPALRYQECQQVIEDLRALQNGQQISAAAATASTSKLPSRSEILSGRVPAPVQPPEPSDSGPAGGADAGSLPALPMAQAKKTAAKPSTSSQREPQPTTSPSSAPPAANRSPDNRNSGAESLTENRQPPLSAAKPSAAKPSAAKSPAAKWPRRQHENILPVQAMPVEVPLSANPRSNLQLSTRDPNLLQKPRLRSTLRPGRLRSRFKQLSWIFCPLAKPKNWAADGPGRIDCRRQFWEAWWSS